MTPVVVGQALFILELFGAEGAGVGGSELRMDLGRVRPEIPLRLETLLTLCTLKVLERRMNPSVDIELPPLVKYLPADLAREFHLTDHEPITTESTTTTSGNVDEAGTEMGW
jgi:hypothetical protein